MPNALVLVLERLREGLLVMDIWIAEQRYIIVAESRIKVCSVLKKVLAIAFITRLGLSYEAAACMLKIGTL